MSLDPIVDSCIESPAQRMSTLPDLCLQAIFDRVDLTTRLVAIPRVCRWWARALNNRPLRRLRLVDIDDDGDATTVDRNQWSLRTVTFQPTSNIADDEDLAENRTAANHRQWHWFPSAYNAQLVTLRRPSSGHRLLLFTDRLITSLPKVTQLTVCDHFVNQCYNRITEHTVIGLCALNRMLDHWAPQLHRLRLQLAVGGLSQLLVNAADNAESVEVQEVRHQCLKLIAILNNRMSALRLLHLDEGFGAMLQWAAVTIDLSMVIARLEWFGCTLEPTLLRQVVKHGAQNPQLVLTDEGYDEWSLDSRLLDCVTKRVARFSLTLDRFSGADKWDQLLLFSPQVYQSLVSLQLTLTCRIQLAKLFDHLSKLAKLRELQLRMNAFDQRCQSSCPVASLYGVRWFSLVTTTSPHIDEHLHSHLPFLESLALALPNLQYLCLKDHYHVTEIQKQIRVEQQLFYEQCVYLRQIQWFNLCGGLAPNELFELDW